MIKTLFKIKRQDAPDTTAYWDYFLVSLAEQATIQDALFEIARNPINRDGKAVAPVAFLADRHAGAEQQNVVLINGKVSSLSRTIISIDDQPITLEPLKSYTVWRDLVVEVSKNRSAASHLLRKFSGFDVPKWQMPDSQVRHHVQRDFITRCTSCLACEEACPNFDQKNDFMGPLALAKSLLTKSLEPRGEAELKILRSRAGVLSCDNDQSCVAACPEGVPLDQHLARVKRGVLFDSVKDFFGV